MSKLTFFLIIFTLFCMIPISFVGILGSMVSHKYEVDYGYNHSYGNEPLTPKEQAENERVAQRDFELKAGMIGFFVLGVLSILGIVILVWRRIKRVMREQSHS